MHGYGIFIARDKCRYEGEFEQGKRHGFGTYFRGNGVVFEGWWVDGKQHGLGTLVDPGKGTKKPGLWEHGQRLRYFEQE